MIRLNNFMPQQIKNERRVCHFPTTGWKECGVFDDAAAGLVREPFISGADNILDVLTENIPDAEADSKSSSRQDPFQSTPPDSFGLEPNTEVIGIAGQRGKWKDGCPRPSSNTSKALPKKSSCKRPAKSS